MKTKLLFLLVFAFALFSLKAQTSLNFDGVNDYVLGTNNASLNLTQGTIEAWIKTSDAGTSYRGIIVKQYNYGIFLNSNELIAFEWISGSLKNTNINLADNIWHHVAFTFQSEVVNGSKLYIDGNPVLTFTYKISHFDRTIA
ncbi:LamG domain-containing protein, partial [Lutibacter sp.]|uniref:LamG domain-containing protein n=1 Tax=Lutibacter sp. TaxID=1925666 RepID=UPI0035669949